MADRSQLFASPSVAVAANAVAERYNASPSNAKTSASESYDGAGPVQSVEGGEAGTDVGWFFFTHGGFRFHAVITAAPSAPAEEPKPLEAHEEECNHV
jgi:hypothetical protein